MLFAAPVWAQTDSPADAPKPDRASQMEKRHADMLKRFDKNGDGKLDDEEKAAAKEMMKNNADHPGQPGGAMREQLLKRFDKDGDGQLNDEERAEAKKAGEEFMKAHGGPGGAGGGKMREEIMKRFDKNGDGQLDESERAAAREAMQKRRAGQ